MTKSEVAKLVAVLMAAYPNSLSNQQTSAAYERMLVDLDYALTNAALERLIATSRYLPSIAEIRETAHAIVVGERRPGGDAWGLVLSTVHRWGFYRSTEAKAALLEADPVAARCVAALGWEELCNSENQQADRARFIELYDKLSVQEKHKALSESLPAMQRYRAIEATRRDAISTHDVARLDAGDARSGSVTSIAQLLPKVVNDE